LSNPFRHIFSESIQTALYNTQSVARVAHVGRNKNKNNERKKGMSEETKSALITWITAALNERQAMVRQLQARVESGAAIVAGLGEGADAGLVDWLQRGLAERGHLIAVLQERVRGAQAVIAQLSGDGMPPIMRN
jgi:hypothetical protein